MNAPLSIGSMCSGYGGLDMAVSAVLDVAPMWVADPDPGAAAILAHRWPDVPNLGDITAVDWSNVPRVDVVAAGFPCTDLSLAGAGAGIKEGTRSGLWLVIAAALGVLRPRLVVLENVRAIVARRPGLDRVLADLASLGFDAEWTCIRASDVGAAHQRERWFLLAWPADPQSPRLQGPRLPRWSPGRGGVAADADRVGDQRHRPAGQPAQRHAPSTDRAAADTAGIAEREPADAPLAITAGGHTRPEPGGRDMQPAAHAPRDTRRIIDRDRSVAADTTCERRHQRRPESARLLGRPDAALGSGSDIDWGAYRPAIDRWARILGRSAPAPRLRTGRNGADQLNPVFVEWLMGLPAGHVTAVPGLTRNQQLKALGNGVVVQQGAAALSILLTRLTTENAASEGTAA